MTPHPDSGLLAGKVILVTGASSGIGAAAARLFASEGASVVAAARRASPLAELAETIRRHGGAATYVVADVSRASDADRLVEVSLERYGRLDGALNNAGVSQGGAALADVDEQDFNRVLDTNITGLWLTMRAEIRALLTAGRPGAIVNVSSVGGLRSGVRLGAYSASKHAVIGLTRTAAREYGAHAIRINAIAPGTTDTPMIAAWKQRQPEIITRLNAATPLGRVAQPAEIAEAAAWLLSDRSSYVTGAILPVDGGLTA